MQNLFQIIYTGQLKHGINKRKASIQLALIINLTPESALKILKSRKEAVLFEQVAKNKVSRLISNLEQLGMVVRVIENNSYPNRTQANNKSSFKQTAPIQKLSKPYKFFLMSFSILSTVVLIGILIYLFILSQSTPYGRITLTDFAGYSQHEICLGSPSCNDAVDDQSDQCYENTIGNIEEWSLLPEDEQDLWDIQNSIDFVNCFIYPETENKVFPEPIALRTDLIEFCQYLSTQDCLLQAGTQFDFCVKNYNMKSLFTTDSQDTVKIRSSNQEMFVNYYSCYLDSNDKKLFESILFMLNDL